MGDLAQQFGPKALDDGRGVYKRLIIQRMQCVGSSILCSLMGRSARLMLGCVGFQGGHQSN